jgi:hypothetical protein
MFVVLRVTRPSDVGSDMRTFYVVASAPALCA